MLSQEEREAKVRRLIALYGEVRAGANRGESWGSLVRVAASTLRSMARRGLLSERTDSDGVAWYAAPTEPK